MDLSTILMNAQNQDLNVRRAAEEQLKSLEQQNLPMYLLSLTAELVNNDKSVFTRRLAGIILKNSLDAKDEQRKAQLTQQWLSVDVNVRTQIKNGILQTLASPQFEARHTAAQVCAKIALIELPQNQWADLVNILLANMTSIPVNDALKQATLYTLGFICEEIDPAVIRSQSNQVLTAVVQGMRTDEQNDDVKRAAAEALYNALEFVKANFENEVERNFIMTVVCDATQSSEPKVRVAAFECLVRIASLYYEKLPTYMQRIFNITLEAIKKDVQEVALQGIEFWSTICDEEIYLTEEIETATAEGTQVPICHWFIRGALKFLLPIITETLTKQDEDADEDTWDVAMAGATCLALIANTVGDELIPQIMPFITQHINNPDWRFREAATMAFGSVLEGPKNYVDKLVTQAIPVLILHMRDPIVHVKDTTAWTIGRICAFHPASIGTNFAPLLQTLIECLNDSPRVASNICWAVHNIAESLEDEDSRPVASFTPYFEPVVRALLTTTERQDSDENNLRTSAYEAIFSIITHSSPDCHHLILQLVPIFLDRLEKTFSAQIVSMDDREAQSELQGLLCGVLQACTSQVSGQIRPFADKMMMLYLQVLSLKSASVHEEALMAVGAVANATEADFIKYMAAFAPFLLVGLRNYEEYTVCQVAVGVVGDVCRALNKAILPYCNDIVSLLLQDTQNPMLNRDVKPLILSCFGDVALAINGDFEPYLSVVLTMLGQASSTVVDPNDDDLVDYLNSLRESILEAYTGIIQGLRTDNKSNLLMPYVQTIIGFVGLIAQDANKSEAVHRGAIGVCGDLGHALGEQVKQFLQHDIIKNLVKEGLDSDVDSTVEVARWVEEIIARL